MKRISSLTVGRPNTDFVPEYDERNRATGRYVYRTPLTAADLKALAAYLAAVADSPVAGKYTVGQLVLEIEMEEEKAEGREP